VHRCTLDLNKLWHGPGFLFSVISNIVCLLSFIIYIESFVPWQHRSTCIQYTLCRRSFPDN